MREEWLPNSFPLPWVWSPRFPHCCGGTGVPWSHLGRFPCSHGTLQPGCCIPVAPQGSPVSPRGHGQGSFPGSRPAPAAPAGRSCRSQGWGSSGPCRAQGCWVIDLYSHTLPLHPTCAYPRWEAGAGCMGSIWRAFRLALLRDKSRHEEQSRSQSQPGLPVWRECFPAPDLLCSAVISGMLSPSAS